MDANQLESAMNNLIEFLWEQWHPDAKEIANLLRELLANDQLPFPENGKLKDAPRTQGVYIIRENGTVLHVGRTYDGKEGLSQRLNNHLSGLSSFAKNYLKVKKKKYTRKRLYLSGSCGKGRQKTSIPRKPCNWNTTSQAYRHRSKETRLIN